MLLTLYHGTASAPFERFLYRFLERDQPINGLGHFCATDEGWARRFGSRVVTVTVDATPDNTVTMNLRELRGWHERGFDACVGHRRGLRLEGKRLIHVLEDGPGPTQWIIADPRVVQQYVW